MNPILLTSSTMSDILPFILAILLIFIIPMLMSRYGISAEDLLRKIFGSGIRKKEYSAADEEHTIRNKKNKKTPHLNNSTHNDIIQMVSDLIIFSRKNKTGLVYPGTIQFGGKTGNIAAFVVTKSKVIGLNCFGFGGRIIHDFQFYGTSSCNICAGTYSRICQYDFRREIICRRINHVNPVAAVCIQIKR